MSCKINGIADFLHDRYRYKVLRNFGRNILFSFNSKHVEIDATGNYVFEIRQWSGRLVLWSRALFPIKNRPWQGLGPYSSASIDLKTGSPDPVDFAMDRPLIHWRVLEIRAMFGRPLAYRAVTAGSDPIKTRQNLPAVAYRQSPNRL
jgi:hypothetical protein